MSNDTLVRPTFSTNVIRQREIEVFTFTVTADELIAIGRVERFGENSDGVNRKYDENHALELAEYMLQPNAVMLDSICGDLKGSWMIDDTGRLVPGEGAYLSIDDGQHRRGACEALNPEERARWSFPVVATRGLDYDTRLKIFRQQKLRKTIDSRLDLSQRHYLGDWKTDAEREAYDLILRLNSSSNSPLKGMISLEETGKRAYENGHKTVGINATGLFSSLKSIMSKRSPLYALSLEKRSEVASNMVFIASEVWAKAWKSDNHVLSTARGVNAVLMLIVSGPNFRVKIGDDFRPESLRAALELAKGFNWTVRAHLNEGTKAMTADLDAWIGRAHQRRLETGKSEIVA